MKEIILLSKDPYAGKKDYILKSRTEKLDSKGRSFVEISYELRHSLSWKFVKGLVAFLATVSVIPILVNKKFVATLWEEAITGIEHKIVHLAQAAGVRPSTLVGEEEFSVEKYAEQFGNKTANLAYIQRLISLLGRSKPSITVPPFIGISSKDVEQFLDKHLPTWRGSWDEVLALQLKGESALSEPAKEKLIAFREAIEKTFSENNFSTQALKSFLKIEEHSRLMVRSTGREDTELLANAGGNESVAAVVPEETTISKSMGKVVSSYFSVRSLTQRLLAKDDIHKRPFCPVLIQQMIGEMAELKDAIDIPSAGVVFSQDPEGLAEGLTVIQSSFGHNMGIVDGVVPVDSWYLFDDGAQHAILRKKQNRVIAQDKQIIANPESLVVNSSLPLQVVKRLKEAAKIFQEQFHSPCDIEFVWDPKKQSLYIVQVRPFIARDRQRPLTLASKYIEEAKPKSLPVQVIGGAGGEGRVITKAQEVLFAPDLETALENYLNKLSAEERTLVKTVIVEKMCPATSHAATIFRGEGITALRAVNLSDAKLALENGISLFADPQRSCLFCLKGLKGSSEEIKRQLIDTHMALEVNLTYPLAPRKTIFHQTASETQAAVHALDDISINLKLAKKYRDEFRKSSLANIFLTISSADPSSPETMDKAEGYLILLLSLFKTFQSKPDIKHSRELVGALKQLVYSSVIDFKHLFVLISEMRKGDGTAPGKLKFLLRGIEALIDQPFNPEFAGQVSLRQLSQLLKEVEAIPHSDAEESLETKILRFHATKIKDLALNDDIVKAWDSFSSILPTLPPEQKKAFYEIFKEVQSFDAWGDWLNISFYKAWQFLQNYYKFEKDSHVMPN